MAVALLEREDKISLMATVHAGSSEATHGEEKLESLPFL